MNLTELKRKTAQELIDIAEEMNLEGSGRAKKHDLVFSILNTYAAQGNDITGDGVLEVLNDGYGFLRGVDSSFLAGPDDVYISPSQIRRFNLRTGDTVSGKIRPPKDNEKYFALVKVQEINYEPLEASKRKIAFENLTPIHPNEPLKMELGNGSSEDITARLIDMVAPIGKGQRSMIVAPPKAG